MELWDFMDGEIGIYECRDGNLRMERWEFMNGEMRIYEWRDRNL